VNEVQASAPTPQDWVELVRENEWLTKRLALAESCLENGGEAIYHEELALLRANKSES
jgi:hypothetical protein